MGLFSDKHYHTHMVDNSTRFPDRIDVHEHKAPTDDSIRLWDEMYEKAIKNIIAKVEVKDNLVEGTAYAINRYATTIAGVQLYFKFKINGREFIIERTVDEGAIYAAGHEYAQIQTVLMDYTKSVMLWYALKSFVAVAFEQLTNQKPPEIFFK